MPRVGFEYKIPVLEPPKLTHALDCAALGNSVFNIQNYVDGVKISLTSLSDQGG
jgi:hypothetical protein